MLQTSHNMMACRSPQTSHKTLSRLSFAVSVSHIRGLFLFHCSLLETTLSNHDFLLDFVFGLTSNFFNKFREFSTTLCLEGSLGPLTSTSEISKSHSIALSILSFNVLSQELLPFSFLFYTSFLVGTSF